MSGVRAPMPFVVGVPRSGTTLLRMMLDAHPELSIPPETGFLIPAFPLIASRPDDLRVRLWETIIGFETWPDMHLSADDLRTAFEEIEPFDPAEAVRTFYRLYARRFGKARWGDKGPLYSPLLRQIEQLLPEASFVHLIRDGRDVAVSVRPLFFSPGSDLETIGRDWRDRIEGARALGAHCRSYLEVRYEELIHRPETELRRICNAIELPFDPAMLRYHERSGERLDEVFGRWDAAGELVISKEERLYNQRFTTRPPDAARIGRWRGELSPVEVAAFERVAGELLDELGYGLTIA